MTRLEKLRITKQSAQVRRIICVADTQRKTGEENNLTDQLLAQRLFFFLLHFFVFSRRIRSHWEFREKCDRFSLRETCVEELTPRHTFLSFLSSRQLCATKTRCNY